MTTLPPSRYYHQHIAPLGAMESVTFDPGLTDATEKSRDRQRFFHGVLQTCRRHGRKVNISWKPVVEPKPALVMLVLVISIDPNALEREKSKADRRRKAAHDRMSAAEVGDLQSRSRWHNWGGMAEGDTASLTVEGDRQLAAATASYMAFARRYGVRFERRTIRHDDGRIEMTVTRTA